MVAAIKARVGSISVGVAAVLVWGVLLHSCLPVLTSAERVHA